MHLLVATGPYPPDIGGPATYSRLLETEFPKRGIEVTVVPFRLVKKHWKGVRHVVYFFRLCRVLWTSDVHSVYAMDPVSVGLPARLAALVFRKTFVLKMVGDYAWEQATQRFEYQGTLEEFQNAKVPLVIAVMRFIERRVARSARAVVVPSQYLASIVRLWGVPADRIEVIYNGVSVGDVGRKDIIRGVLHFSGTLLISVGRLVRWKGFDTVIRVFARIRKRFKPAKLMIVGSGPDLERLEALASREGVQDDVIFSGAVDHEALLRYLRASDILVLNTSYEGLSHLLLETMAVGVPIVTTAVGGNPETIEDGVSGYLVKPNDMTALESRVARILNEPELASRLVRAGHERVSMFTDERMLTETAKFFTTLSTRNS